MNTNWTTKAFSKNSTPVAIDDDILDEKVVILMQGNNVFGDRIFSYVQLTLRKLQELRGDLASTKDFLPSDYGTVLAAGKGDPSPELRSEMAITYNMIDVPKSKPAGGGSRPAASAGAAAGAAGAHPAAPKPKSPMMGFNQPRLWEE